MYDIIQMTMNGEFTESVELTPEVLDKFYSEAVFVNGKEKLAHITEIVGEIKSLLESEIKKQEESEKTRGGKKYFFDPQKFWKHKLFKDLEDEFQKVFGFRIVEIQPYRERYVSKDKEFETYELNAWVYDYNRYPVEGLVTDQGFYDQSHSLVFSMVMTLGMFVALEPDELVGVIMHEFGHKVDPALTNITYIETNIFSKYLTDRVNSLTDAEKAFIKKMEKRHSGDKKGVIPGLILLIFLIWISLGEIFGAIGDFIYKILPKSMKEKIDKKRAEKIEKKIRALLKKYDSELFKRQTYSEAYADNFARMYGYGAPLMRGLHKLDKKLEKDINTYFKREADRRKCIMNFTECLLRDVHKTNVHRARNIIREYRKEIDDPNTPAEVKKQLEADVKELEIFLDKYLNDFSEMQNNINKVINENITKLEKEEDKKEAKEKAKEEKKKEEKKDK